MVQQCDKPVLFIVWKRLDKTKKVFEKIREARPKKLYIASDGPRNKQEEEIVLRVREYIVSSVDWECELKTKFNEVNLGVAFGPNNAIDWFFSEQESGIILEDDCLPQLSFFRFCSELLDFYRDNKKIGVVQGFNPFSTGQSCRFSYFFSKYDLKWGWATWRDRWQLQDMYTTDWPIIKASGTLGEIFGHNKLARSYWENLFDLAHQRPEDMPWDTQFTYQMLKRGLLAVVPKRNLVLNIGYDSEASTTRWGVPKHMRCVQLEDIDFPLIHPPQIEANERYDHLVERIHFDMSIGTISRLRLRSLLSSNNTTRNTILPALVCVYRAYKRIKEVRGKL